MGHPKKIIEIKNFRPDEVDLRQYSLLSTVSDDLLRAVASGLKLIRVHRNRTIFHQGEENTSFFMVKEGWVRVLRETSQGRRVLFEIVSPGDIVGTVAVVEQRPYPATAVAATETDLFVLPGKKFLELIRTFPELQENYSKVLSERLRGVRDMQVQSMSSVEQRIAALLLRLDERMGMKGSDGLKLHRILTRQDMADMVGTTVESTIRVISRWKKSGILSEDDDYFYLQEDELQTLVSEG